MDLSMSPQPPYILNGEFFEILSQEGESVTVRCCYCDGSRNIYKGSVKSTGNFHMHIKRKHPGLLERVHESKLKAFLSRKSMQQQRRLSGKRRLVKTERDPIDEKMIPNQSQLQAIDLKVNPQPQAHSKMNSYIKNEPHNYVDANRQMRNIFSAASNNLVDLTSATQQLASQRFPATQQTEPTNLSQPQARTPGEYILPRIETTLRSIDRELKLRNQIESNRLFLELAKFKYINPDFHFRF